MRVLFVIMLCLFSSAGLAGGDYFLGKVIAFAGENGNYTFRFAQSGPGRDFWNGCKELTVRVHYQRVPWFSWLPFVYSSHPTKQQTEIAALFLQGASRAGQEVYFGYLGYGLVPNGACAFSSRGLRLDQDNGKPVVFSYHDLI